MTRAVVVLIVLLGTVLGLAFSFVSGVLARFSESWWIDVLLGLGTTLLLFIPLYFIGLTLDRHVAAAREQIREVREDADNLNDRVTGLQESIDRRLEDVHAIVEQRLREERSLDEEALRALATKPSREALVEAMTRAEDLHLVDAHHPPRVDVSEKDYLYLQVAQPTSEEQWSSGRESLEFELVSIDGTCLATVPWPADQSLEDVMVQVGRELQALTREDFDSGAFFKGLSQLLQVGLTSPDRCPVVQLVPPQWVITGSGSAIPYDKFRGYSVSARQLHADHDFEAHVKGKTWVDPDSFDKATHILSALFPESPPEPLLF